MDGSPSNILTQLSYLLTKIQVRPLISRRKDPRLVAWSKLLLGWIKLNVDSSCRGNLSPCGGGGILRDEHRNFKVAFSEKLEFGTNNEAKHQALISGVKLCKIWGSSILHWKLTLSLWWAGLERTYTVSSTYGIAGKYYRWSYKRYLT